MSRYHVTDYRDLKALVSELMGEDATDQNVGIVAMAIAERGDAPAYGDSAEDWQRFFAPLDLWRIYEKTLFAKWQEVDPSVARRSRS